MNPLKLSDFRHSTKQSNVADSSLFFLTTPYSPLMNTIFFLSRSRSMSNLRNQPKSGELHKAGGAAAASDAEHLSPPDLLSSSPKIFSSHSNARKIMADGPKTDIIRQILVKKIKDRGAVEGLVDLTTGDDKASKFLQLACVVHETPDKVVDFFLSESKEGKFRRHIC